ncbi:MAG: multidrug efflux MFS transporter [Clostridiales Family XIII bacterium]|jgi:EmrB/QacA subfamily drug resistance transporter|nr:multidrug efflux MFS transporter [Clostridiales Family XIII bacterium]
MKSKLTKKTALMIAIIIAGGFITILNQTVMSPALPSVMRDFGITAADGQWLTSIFLLVNGLMVPITAWLIGRYTTRQLFITSMLCFLAGTAVCAVSPSFMILLGGRVLQAVSAGILMPFAIVILMLVFPKERRGFALGMAGVVMGFAPAFGPTVAGWLVDEWGWKYIFWGIMPLTVIVIVLAAALLTNVGQKTSGKLDVASVAMSTLGFGGLLFGFSSAGSTGWISPQTLGAIAVGAVFSAMFIRRQLSRDLPLLDLRVLKNSIFADATVITMVVSAGLTVGAVITPIYLQNVLGVSAMRSGILLMPGALLMAALSPVSGTLFDKFGPRALCIVGISALAVGTTMLALMGAHASEMYICLAYTARMGGIAFVNMPVNTWGINALDHSRIAHGNAVNNTGRLIAGSIGTAVLVTIMVIIGNAHGGGGAGSAEATAAGVSAAYLGAAALTVFALILAIIKVRDTSENEDEDEL